MTDKTKEFFTALTEKCKKSDIPKKEVERAKTYLEPNFKKNKILDWYFSLGPFPKPMQNTTLDCFILTENFLFNCEFKKNVPFIHMIPISEVVNISEGIEENKIMVSISIASLSGIVIWDSFKNRDKLEKFINKIRNKLYDFE